ncbi:MAG TPA: cytidylate kinase-like family protein [Desulfopila sp.]|nr:cytidylate kinase-like family protein [Desulfopila sp.]
MTIITLSKGACSNGESIATKVAERLGYRSISREVVLEASQDYHIPEDRLARALHDAPSLIDRITYEKQQSLVYVTAKLLRWLQRDNVVYHGLGGHFFASDVSHHLRVRILARMEDRVTAQMGRLHISRKKALSLLENEDRERRAWSRDLYGVDTFDMQLYDLVINLDRLRVEDAVDLVCETAGRPQFQATAESLEAVVSLALAAEAKALLARDFPGCDVHAEREDLEVTVRLSPHREKAEAASKIESILCSLPAVEGVQVNIIPATLFG